MTKEATLSIYNTIGWIAVAVGVAVLAVSPFVKKLMHLDTLGDDRDRTLAGRSELAENQAPGMFPQRGEQAPDDGKARP